MFRAKNFHCAVLLQKRRIVLFNTSSFRGISTKVSELSRHLQWRVKKPDIIFDITVISVKPPFLHLLLLLLLLLTANRLDAQLEALPKRK
jgi:hypothetical protein